MWTERGSGILFPIFSLPSKYGIGCFSKEAYKFVDDLKRAGQKYWQILPLCPTGYGDSPYQAFSSFAGNPYFIDLEQLIDEELLTLSECESLDFGNDKRYIDYEKIYHNRLYLLKLAFDRWYDENENHEIDLKEQTKEYCLFMAIKDRFDGFSWIHWDIEIKKRETVALNCYKKLLKREIMFYEFLQLKFNEHWNKLKAYANHKGIQIIGDIPIYVALDSADAWSNPNLFEFDQNYEPINVAGCPPDAFSPTGQLWGNPLYDWDEHKNTDFKWWCERIEHSLELYDIVRIDHFRGFSKYYAIPYKSLTTINGKWKKGPNIDFFETVRKTLGEINIFAEDLGIVTEDVIDLLEKSGCAGMKIIEYAFDSREKSDYLPHNYTKNSIVYTGTHDNDTLVGWYNFLCDDDKKIANDYINYNQGNNDIHWEFIRLTLGSVCNTAIIQLQDYIGLGSEARINIPSTFGSNWRWRLLEGEFSDEIIDECLRLNKIYCRT